ncbi:hypothetical protein [Nitrosomonas supralitoralis]|uniref:DUF2946 domain-containing protein n=1 Tax=Nitrosomonas supralitoralis TaxID=2116706 RepID=A0A2P7NW70_9PROT|nr:hypothetical protein [Nitrosomonas supralitoralis]PSJ17724.1 hypothetical protein C7H79_06635 [Nitrosomonas supralitoralis]
MIRKSLFLILALAILSVPVFLMAHAFTHYTQTDGLEVSISENDTGIDLDEICLDCLALTALNLLLIAIGLFLRISVVRHRLPLSAMRWHSDSKTACYFSRAPPLRFF